MAWMFSVYTHDAQILERSLGCLSLITTQLTELQRQQLAKLSTEIHQLCLTLKILEQLGGLIDRDALHNIRSQLSIVSIRAQLLRTKNAAELGSSPLSHLEQIVGVCEHINIVVGIALKRL